MFFISSKISEISEVSSEEERLESSKKADYIVIIDFKVEREFEADSRRAEGLYFKVGREVLG